MSSEWFTAPGWLAVAVLLPLILAGLLGVERLRGVVVRVAPLGAVPALGLALWGPSGLTLDLPWLLQGAVLLLDETARVFLGFSGVLYFAAAWYARTYLEQDESAGRFFVMLFAAMAGNFLLIVAGDVAAFYGGFALMGLASAGLVLHRGDSESRRAGRIYLTLAMLGEVLIFAGLTYLVFSGGTIEIAALHREVAGQPAVILVLVGFGIKAGMLTLHFWLPLAHPAAPVPASAVLSGAMIKAGLLGWMRFLPLGETMMPNIGYGYILAGLGAAALGTVMGVVQNNPKTVLAYSSVSQMGIIMTGLGIGALRPSNWPGIETAVLIYATHHALAKGALFLGVAPAAGARTRGERFVARWGLLLPALALAGAPFTSGALAKVALKSQVGFLPGPWSTALTWLLPLAAVGTTLIMARFLWLTWPRAASVEARGARAGMWVPWLGVVAAMLVGIWMLPGTIEWVPAKLSWSKLWGATWPLVAGSVLAVLGAWLRRGLTGDLARRLPAGDLGVILERAVARWLPMGEDRQRQTPVVARDHDPVPGGLASEGSPASWIRVLSGWLHRAEQAFCSWPVAGGLWALGFGWLLWLLWQPF